MTHFKLMLILQTIQILTFGDIKFILEGTNQEISIEAPLVPPTIGELKQIALAKFQFSDHEPAWIFQLFSGDKRIDMDPLVPIHELDIHPYGDPTDHEDEIIRIRRVPLRIDLDQRNYQLPHEPFNLKQEQYKDEYVFIYGSNPFRMEFDFILNEPINGKEYLYCIIIAEATRNEVVFLMTASGTQPTIYFHVRTPNWFFADPAKSDIGRQVSVDTQILATDISNKHRFYLEITDTDFMVAIDGIERSQLHGNYRRHSRIQYTRFVMSFNIWTNSSHTFPATLSNFGISRTPINRARRLVNKG